MKDREFWVDGHCIEYNSYYNYYIVRRAQGEVLGYINGLDVCGSPKKLNKRIQNIIKAN